MTRSRTMRGVLSDAMAAERLAAAPMAALCLVALALTAGGIYGVMADSVGRRSQEIGVRLASARVRRRYRRW